MLEHVAALEAYIYHCCSITSLYTALLQHYKDSLLVKISVLVKDSFPPHAQSCAHAEERRGCKRKVCNVCNVAVLTAYRHILNLAHSEEPVDDLSGRGRGERGP